MTYLLISICLGETPKKAMVITMWTSFRVLGQIWRTSSWADSEVAEKQVSGAALDGLVSFPCPPFSEKKGLWDKPLNTDLLTTVFFIFSTVTITFTITPPGHGDALSRTGATADFIYAACSHICWWYTVSKEPPNSLVPSCCSRAALRLSGLAHWWNLLQGLKPGGSLASSTAERPCQPALLHHVTPSWFPGMLSSGFCFTWHS